tara:strand:- start:14734 stop:16191 length:1458 start_codon:yes stop_codon:yes gene_type:complete
LEVILSILGLAIAAWAIIDAKKQEHVRVKVALNVEPLLECFVCAVALAVLIPGIQSWIPDKYAGWESLAVIGAQILILACAFRAVTIIYPNENWNHFELEQFEPRIERLLLTGSATVVVDVLSEAFPKSLPPRGPGLPIPDSQYANRYDQLLERAIRHEEFLRAAAVQDRQYLSQLLSRESNAAFWNVEKILNELMFGKEKILRRELRLCTNFGDKTLGHYYRIPDECVVLHAIFDHIPIAYQIHAWKAVGEGVLRYISTAKNTEKLDLEQLPFNDGEKPEDVRWDSDIGASIWFFRLMATSAAIQGTTAHMWLPYLRYFVKGIVGIAQVPDHEPWEEYPNRYCYWIRDCLECLEDVISMTSKIQSDNPNYPTLQQDSSDTIITWSLQLTSDCLRTLFKSDHIPESTKENAALSLCLEYEDWKSHDYPTIMPEFAIKHLSRSLDSDQLILIVQYLSKVVDNNIYRDTYRELRDKLLEQANQKQAL